MPNPLDLCSLAQVKAWLPNMSGTSSDVLLGQLITAVSRSIHGMLAPNGQGSHIGVGVYNEVRNGTGTSKIWFRNFPAFRVNLLVLDASTIQAATVGLNPSYGYAFDRYFLSLVNIGCRYGFISQGISNLSLNYSAGWTLPNQTTQGWNAATVYQNAQTIQPLSNNPGKFVYVCSLPGTSGIASPQFNQTPGQPTIDGQSIGGVVWLNTGVISLPTSLPDGQANLLPDDIAEACVEWVGLRFRERDRIGLMAETMGGQQTTSFLKDPMPASVKYALMPYVIPIPVAAWD